MRRIKWIRLLTVISTLLLAMSVSAQDKELTLQELIPGGKNYSRFVPKELKQLNWCGERYFYVKGDSVWGAKPERKEQVLFTREQLNQALTQAGLPTVGKLPTFKVPFAQDTHSTVLAFNSHAHQIHFDYQKQKVTADYALKSAWSNLDFCTANQYFAYTNGNNLFLLSPKGDTTIVTNEQEEGIVCGQAVHQREFGITKGTFWSPQGNALAFYRMDERMVTTYPLVNIDSRCATLVPHKYPMAGMKSHEVTVGIYQLATGKTIWLKTGLPKEKYLTNIAWSPDERSIYLIELKREQNEQHLVRYSAETGEREAVLITESDHRYVEPQHPILFLPNDPNKFIWQTEADGYNHLYLFDTDGNELRKLTGGEWVVTRVLGFSEGGDKLIIEGTAPHPVSPSMHSNGLSRYVWAVNLKEQEIMNCLSWKVGVHSWKLSPSGAYALDNVSSSTVPREIDLIQVKEAKVVRTLLTAPDPYKGYRMPKIQTGTLTAADGKTKLNYRLTLPPALPARTKTP